jgi:hypothetical protein
MKSLKFLFVLAAIFCFSFSYSQNFRVKAGNFRNGDTLTLADFNSLDSIEMIKNADFRIISYSCIIVPWKGDAILVSCQGNSLSMLIKTVPGILPKGGRIVIDCILKNRIGEKRAAKQLIFTLIE